MLVALLYCESAYTEIKNGRIVRSHRLFYDTRDKPDYILFVSLFYYDPVSIFSPCEIAIIPSINNNYCIANIFCIKNDTSIYCISFRHFNIMRNSRTTILYSNSSVSFVWIFSLFTITLCNMTLFLKGRYGWNSRRRLTNKIAF